MSEWIKVCELDDLVKNSGVCALINEKQIAVFLLSDGNDKKLFATSNWDPIGKANVMYRGLIGSFGDKNTVASPLYKQRYCLETGACLDDPAQKLDVYGIRVDASAIQIQVG